MTFRLIELKKSVEIDLETLEAIAFCLQKLSCNPGKTIKSSWARKYALEVGICAELNLISLRTDYHEMSRDSKVKIVKEFQRLDFSMAAWHVTRKGHAVLTEIKEKYLKPIRFRIELFEKDPFGDDEKYYLPAGWILQD